MLLSHNWLKSYYTNRDALPEPQKVAELFTMHAFEVESVEEKGSDTIYDIKITPDRGPYAHGIRYVALELSLLVPELNLRPELFAEVETPYTVNEKLATDNRATVYSLTKIENLENTPSLDWLREKLEVIGQQSRGLIVDITNLSMFDTGQPLHAYDADKVDGNIYVGKSTEGENITILGGKEIALPTDTLVIRDEKDILAIAGVKGGIKAEVDSNTKNIYLESAHFNSVSVRKTARGLNLLNDSSKRFEQNLTLERFLLGQKTYVDVLLSILPEAKVSEMEVSTDLKSLLTTHTISVDVVSSSISIDKENAEVPRLFKNFLENTLPKTGAKVEKKDKNTYIVTQPHYRADLKTQADVVDEFLRNKGYDFLEYTEPKKHKVEGLQDPMDKLCAVLRDFFIQRGFDEVRLHTLVDSKNNPKAVKLENSLTSERDSLRSELSSNLTDVLEQNIKHLDLVGKDIVKIFEIGNVFTDQKTDIKEDIHMAFGVAMAKWPKGKSSSDYISDISDELGEMLGEIMISEKGTVTGNCFTQEVSLEEMLKHVSEDKLNELVSQIQPYKLPEKIAYKKASIYPAMSRDIAFFGSQDQGEVAEFIKTQVEKHPLIENYFCFDVFTKEDKTSYAYRFVFQSYEKTLTEDEVAVFMNEIAEAVKEKGWEVR